MAAKALKWQVNTALRSSRLPPPSRLIMFVMSDLADSQSGIIISALTPSLRELAGMTGLSEATVKRHRAELIALGWLLHIPPTAAEMARHEPGQYRIALGSEGSQRTPERKDSGAQSEPPEFNLEQEYGPDAGAQAEPPAGAQSDHPEDDSGAQGELPNENPGAHSELSGGSERALAGAQSEPPYIEDYYQDEVTTSFMSADAATATSKAAKPKGKREAKPKPPPRPDVTRICTHLADRIEGNGSNRPNIGQGWLDAARFMLDRDGRTEDDVHAAIDWSQNHEFWRGNVLSMPKLREKYDQLRLQAERASPARRPVGAQHLVEAAERAERMRLLDEAEAAGQAIPNLFQLPPGRTT